jgi:pimeloyl-ACP methyl ester carboxylesterase
VTTGRGRWRRRTAVATALIVATVAGGGCSAVRHEDSPIARRTGFVDAPDGTPIYYEAAGSGPAVVFVHGLGGNHAVWFHQVPYFARAHTAITVSQRGFAPSGGDGERFDVATLVDDLVGVMDALGIDEADVVGQSMGGWTALGLALRAPERVRSLVLADTLAGIGDDVIDAHYEAMIARAEALGRTPPPLGVHPAIDPELTRTDLPEAYLYQLLSTFGAPAPAVIAGQLGRSRFGTEELAANDVRTLFVVGERDRIFPPSIVRHAAERLGNSDVAVLVDSGHSPYYERPDCWNDVVEDFQAGRRTRRPKVPRDRRPLFRLWPRRLPWIDTCE